MGAWDCCSGAYSGCFSPTCIARRSSTLAAEGFEVLAPTLPNCCGALELHAGEEESAVLRARATVAAFAQLGDLDYVVVNAAGCGAAMKEYGDLLGTPEASAFSRRVRDVCELLASVPPRAKRGLGAICGSSITTPAISSTLSRSAPSHASCCARFRDSSCSRSAPSRAICCGSAGIYNLVQPRAAAELGARKAKHLLDTGAQAIAAGNPGCAAQLDMHLRELGQPLPIHHPIELLWSSISGVGAPAGNRGAGP